MQDGTLVSVKEAEGQPPDARKVLRRWKIELDLADKGEEDWRKEAQNIWDVYKGEKCKRDSYNILYPNTEILHASTYNSLPKPDIRRRFRDKDPLGKAVGEMLGRAVEYTLDVYGYDAAYREDVLDMLIPGRAITRYRYKPTTQGQDGNESLTWECVMPEHVQWDDFRHGAGKTPAHWTWIAFRHRMTRDEMVQMFGEEIGNAVTLDGVSQDDETLNRMREDDVKNSFKTAEVWEIWDKDQRRVLFISNGYDAGALKEVPDPLGIDGFFPCPNPLYAVMDSESTTPIALYTLYKEQAEELNRVSARINKTIQAIKVRAIYDSTIAEMEQITNASDAQLIPAGEVSRLIEMGGLEKGIWFWPVDKIAQVLNYLYQSREQTKSVIYELTGISDIARGSTNASETLGAQQLKANFNSLRSGRMKQSVENYIRDSVRIVAGIIAEKFSPQTLMAMTNLQFPSEQQVQMQFQQQMGQWQQAAQQAQASGQQPPPPPEQPDVITIEAVMEAMRSNMTRSYKIDIETDSTVQQTIDSDLQGIAQAGQAIAAVTGALGPLVETGVIPPETLKEMVGAVSRRARLGNAVEDSIDQIGQNQQGNPKEAQAQIEQAQQQLQQQAQEIQKVQEQIQSQADAVKADSMKLEQAKQSFNSDVGEFELAKKDAGLDLERQKMDIDAAAQKFGIAYEKVNMALQQLQQEASSAEPGKKGIAEGAQNDAIRIVTEAVNALTAAQQAPRKVLRDKAGKISGVETVQGTVQ